MNNYIKTFQSANDLVADGIIGKKTLTKFKEVLKLTNEETAHFLGQCFVESGGFTVFEENLNYSANRLREVFPHYFDYLESFAFQHKPELIANRVYGNRMGNGDEKSGDGWKYRGRGLIQLTGKNNYKAFSKYINDDLIFDNPSLVSDKYALESAAWYFNINNILNYCDSVNYKSVLNVSRIINCGNVKSKLIPNSLEQRLNNTIGYYNKLLLD